MLWIFILLLLRMPGAFGETEESPILHIIPRIIDVSVERDTLTGKHQILISATSDIQFAAVTLDNPARIILDIQGAALSSDYKAPLFKDETIKEIVAAQFGQLGEAVRVIITLGEGVKYVILPRDNQSQIKIDITGGSKIPKVSPQVGRRSPIGEPATEGQFGTGKEPVRLVALSTEEQKINGGVRTIITMQASGEVNFEWHRLRSPDNRIFFDFKHCILAVPAKELLVDNIVVEKVKSGQFEKAPPVVRVVAYLKDAYEIRITTKEDYKVVLEIDNKEVKEEFLFTGNGAATLEGALPVASIGKGKVIVIDPGHGGSDTGALNGRQGMVEKELTLDIALRLERILRKLGFQVIMTRKTDIDVLGYKGGEKEELQARVNVANKKGADLFVSIHINASYSARPNGASIHWYKALDLPLARMLHKHLSVKSGFLDRGISRNQFYVVRHTQMPATLLELGFITNPNDETLLAKDTEREQLASAIKEGIVDFFGGIAQQKKRSTATATSSE